MNTELEKSWKQALSRLSALYGQEPDLQAVLFLIGVQELGKGYQKFTKDQKIDLIHIAICRLLTPYGYYQPIGRDIDGWPHWKSIAKLPPLKPGQQLQLMKQAVIEYFT